MPRVVDCKLKSDACDLCVVVLDTGDEIAAGLNMIKPIRQPVEKMIPLQYVWRSCAVVVCLGMFLHHEYLLLICVPGTAGLHVCRGWVLPGLGVTRYHMFRLAAAFISCITSATQGRQGRHCVS